MAKENEKLLPEVQWKDFRVLFCLTMEIKFFPIIHLFCCEVPHKFNDSNTWNDLELLMLATLNLLTVDKQMINIK